MIADKELTKEQALSEHRKMWNWIADQLSLENCKVYDGSELKEKYVTEIYKGDESIVHNCFCCEYDTKFDGNACSHCPILWGTEDVTSSYFCERGDDYGIKGLWTLCDYLTMDKQYKEASIIAKKIANLPEK